MYCTRRLRARFLLAWGCLQGLAQSTKLIPPSKDPWYTPTQGFEKAAPGTILRSRIAPANVSSLVEEDVAETYQLLFRSRDNNYQPSFAVTTLFLPSKATEDDRNSRALLSYQIPYNSIDVDLSPSYGLSTIYGEPLMRNVREGLRRGWAVSVPDFEGPESAFSAGAQAGSAVLDSVRAVLSFRKFKGPQEGRYAMWGYSGGAFASDWAAELQASYAPELEFAGMAMGGVLSNWTQILYNVTGSPVATIVSYSLWGVTAQDPAGRSYLLDHLKNEGPYNATEFLATLKLPTAEAIATWAGRDIFAYFTNGPEILKAPIMARLLGNNYYEGYHGIPQMPVFAYKAIHDENTNIRTTDEHIARICGVGANVLYQRNTLGNHTAEEQAGVPRAFEWLGRVLDGDGSPVKTGCKIENVTVPLPAN